MLKSPPEEQIKQAAKRRRDNSGVSIPSPEVIDVADTWLKLKSGDKIEVKWTINDEEDEESPPPEAAAALQAPQDAKGVTVWWAAEIQGKTDNVHTLSDEERQEGDAVQSSDIKVPIYRLSYAPMEELGFEGHYLEDVVFISHKTLLNLSTDEMMTFRMAGEASPPPSPLTVPEEAAAKDESTIATVCNGQEEMGNFMDALMQSTLEKIGVDQRMANLAPSQQMMIAERIHKAKEGFLAKMLSETEKMSGDKVITADVVRKCMSDMNEETY